MPNSKKATTMATMSAGLLMYRYERDRLEVFLVHPGGPFFKNKDEGTWGIPKGMLNADENHFDAAKREFEEETGIGICPNCEEFIQLDTVKYRGGKKVKAWAFEGNWDESQPIRSNTFELEYPPKSGKMTTFPEVDKGAFFTIKEAVKKVMPAQYAFLKELQEILKERNLLRYI